MTQASALSKENPSQIAANLTPMMRQYLEIKSQYEDAILFYRLGDFYEMFYDDAVEASRLLSLTLTTRNKNSENPVPLCGIPHHASEGYIAKLIKCGKKVVVCEQTEDPKKAKGLVKRGVTRVVSPGILMQEESLTARAHNFILCFLSVSSNLKSKTASNDNQSQKIVCTLCDVSTGLLEYFSLKSHAELIDEIARLQIKEVFYAESERDSDIVKLLAQDQAGVYQHAASDLLSDADFAKDLLFQNYSVQSLASLGLQEKDPVIRVLGMMLGYLQENKVLAPGLLQHPLLRQSDQTMILDEAAVRNLELFKTLRDDQQQGTLLWHLDDCQTPMGSRRLADFIRAPLMSVKDIEARLEAVELILKNSGLYDNLIFSLEDISDLERLANRFVLGSANARDALGLKQSLQQLPALKGLIKESRSDLLQELCSQVHNFDALACEIEKTLCAEPNLSLKEGGLIATGVNDELDELRLIEKNGKSTIVQMEASERLRTGISTLKIRYNNVFGYYIDVTNTHKDKVPADYIRKQTLANSERYITDELKKYETKVLGASERIKNLEYGIFCELRDKIQQQCERIKESAQAIGVLDVMQSFATIARKYNYVRPQISAKPILDLKGARHPILERLNPGESFVPNDVSFDAKKTNLMMITGPNMAGKSTVMRMAAVQIIMAQMGCFVPCQSAKIGLCDRVFTRVGAHDHLQKGLSTFMVEMVETARILREATERSFIVLDEIGRGTSTFDGLSIAWAVAEDIHDRIKARTMFATHYHELCDLSDQKEGIQNFHMAVKEWNGEIIFLRQFKQGGTNRSYGVAVAHMAGLPPSAIERAKEILKLLELKDMSFQTDLSQKQQPQMSLFEMQESKVVEKIKQVDVNTLTPIAALQFLAELKESL